MGWLAELCRRILHRSCTLSSEFGMFSPLQHLRHFAEQRNRCQTHDGSFGCSGRAKEKQPATKFLHEDLFSWLAVITGRSFVGWGCQNKLHPSPAPFSLEEGAAVDLFICLCSMNRIREKDWEKWDKESLHMVMSTETEDLCLKQWKNSKHVFIFCILPFTPSAVGKMLSLHFCLEKRLGMLIALPRRCNRGWPGRNFLCL